MKLGFFQLIAMLSEILLIPSYIDLQRQQEQIATGLKEPILSSYQSASSNPFLSRIANRRTASLAIAQVSTRIQDQAFQIIKYQQNLLLMRKKLSQARKNVLRTGFKLNPLLQSTKPFKQLNQVQSWTSVYWKRALKFAFGPSILDQNSKSILNNVQTLQEEEIAFDSNLNQDSEARGILRNDEGLQQIMPNSSPRITQSKQPIQIEQSSIGSKHISNDGLSSDRVTKKKTRLSQVDSLMKDVHDPKNGAVSVPHKQFETDSNDSEEDAFGKDEHEATNNHVKVIKQTLLPKQQSPSKSKINTTDKLRQLAKTKKTTNHGSTSLDTLGHWSQ